MTADVEKTHTVYMLKQSSISYKLRNLEMYFEKLWLPDNVALMNSNSEFCVIWSGRIFTNSLPWYYNSLTICYNNSSSVSLILSLGTVVLRFFYTLNSILHHLGGFAINVLSCTLPHAWSGFRGSELYLQHDFYSVNEK